MSQMDIARRDVTSPGFKEEPPERMIMDSRSTNIFLEGEIISDDNFFHSPPRMEAPHSAPHSSPHSAPQSRCSSFRNRPRPRLNLDIEAALRPRTNSLPDAYLPLPDPFFMPETGRIQRVRSFKTTSKGLVNHGDSFKKSTNSLVSNGSAGSISDGANKSPRRSSLVSEDSSGTEAAPEPQTNPNLHSYRVLMMGASGVGKTSLTRQFMTSEYKGTYAESNTPDILEPERNVSVLLDGQESTLHFLNEEQHPNFDAEEIPIDAFVVVFSVSNSMSYNHAIKTVCRLREDYRTNKAIILVGNKIDLARQRRVTRHDATRAAKKYCCRYTETSAALNHHVDELLVGILSQIRAQLQPSSSSSRPSSSSSRSAPRTKHRSRSKSPGKALAQFFSKIFGGDNRKTKSSDVLFVQ